MTKQLIEKNGVYEILRNLSRGKKRFSELLSDVPRKTLSDRIQELESGEYVRREIIMSHPIKTEYVITDKGQQEYRKIALEITTKSIGDLIEAYPKTAGKLLSSYLSKLKKV